MDPENVVHEAAYRSSTFGVADYAVFILMLLLCAAIGVYFGFFAGARSVDDYLMGGRSMGTIPISISLIASYVSGITLLGTPTEVYVYGGQYIYVVFGLVVMCCALIFGYLPPLHDLKLTSTYEYLERRFDRSVRMFGSLLFATGNIAWVPIVMYVPALALNQVTGISVYVITPLVSLVCIFYTCVGGLKAVVWTDVVQTVAMFGSLLLVIAKGTIDVGGFSVVWQRNWDSGRIEGPNWDPDPTIRHSWWSLVFGGAIYWLQANAVNQNQCQRYLALPTLTKARIAAVIFVFGSAAIVFLCSYCGFLIYATYHNCDPITTQEAKRKDQLLPLLVMRTLGSLPGLPGCFVAGVFSAALSSMSTALNSMAAIVLEDFYKMFVNPTPTDKQANLLVKGVVLVCGVLCIGLVFVVERLGTVQQVAMSLASISHGPLLGVFTTGLLLPWVNAKGMLVGGGASFALMGWLVVGTQASIAAGHIRFEEKPFSTAGCGFAAPNATRLTAHSQVLPLYRMSYLWYTLLGCLISMAVALPVSFLTGANDAASVDRRLLSPLVRWLLPSRSPSRERSLQLHDRNDIKAVELLLTTRDKTNCAQTTMQTIT